MSRNDVLADLFTFEEISYRNDKAKTYDLIAEDRIARSSKMDNISRCRW